MKYNRHGQRGVCLRAFRRYAVTNYPIFNCNKHRAFTYTNITRQSGKSLSRTTYTSQISSNSSRYCQINSYTSPLGKFSSTAISMAPKQLNFITGNKNKLAEVQAILAPTGVDLRNQNVDLLEIQGTIEEISKDKCRRAADTVCKNSRFEVMMICD